MTLSDLDNHEIKRNKFVKNYIYIFHAASSIHKSYTISAFDNYDEIFVVSKNQKKELRSMEKLRNLRKKKITDIGYFYLDHIQKNKKHKISNCILIAPSWNYSDDNFSSKYLFKLLQNLFLKTSKNIILRPHPEQLKRDKSLITYINQKFAKKKNFTLDLSSSNFESLSTSEILITDNSAISIEFILGFEKPVIFFDNYLKIHNKSYKDIGNETIEDEIKKKFGYLIKNPDFEKIDFYLNDAISQFQNKQKNIVKFRDENFFNLGKSTEIACNYIHKNYL